MKQQLKILIFGILVSVFGFSCNSQSKHTMDLKETSENTLKLFLCGDVMTGRGVDQALPNSVNPVLYESYIKDARDYLKLAERESGKIDTPLNYDYIWGDALKVWKQESPRFLLINLETSITTNQEAWPRKGIHYRMHPENVKVLTAAGVGHISLANNHVMDWGHQGLIETIETLEKAGIAYSGAGRNEIEAKSPSILEYDRGRLLVLSYGYHNSGIPPVWEAAEEVPGVNLLHQLNETELENITKRIQGLKKAGDVVVFSIHWGGNWGYDVPSKHRDFAHRLIDEAGVDLIYGHSSHHPMGLEVYKEKLIIYGAGDFINDYEGISGNEEYRGELTLMYFPEVDIESGKLLSLKMIPMKIKKLRLNHASRNDAEWLQKTLDREGKELGTGLRLEKNNSIWLEW
ncbi:CapA family protein [Salegentibacter sp. JZCK2]|uniref:CapA family protein n=1 Tax=Salegentibacter tibetensis TaxID=2873600 RepID=UPI001CC9CDB9|nr:CapA family protein [Salegentibacter tibetensis]MBZ9728709.1 CapA family protein [Salegentibacter tibetensis]